MLLQMMFFFYQICVVFLFPGDIVRKLASALLCGVDHVIDVTLIGLGTGNNSNQFMLDDIIS